MGSEKTLSYFAASSPPSSVRLHLFNPGFSSCCFPGRQGLIANKSTGLPPCASTLGLVPISHPQVCGEWTGDGDYQQRNLRGLSAAINRSKNTKYQNIQTFGRALTGGSCWENPDDGICGWGRPGWDEEAAGNLGTASTMMLPQNIHSRPEEETLVKAPRNQTWLQDSNLAAGTNPGCRNES